MILSLKKKKWRDMAQPCISGRKETREGPVRSALPGLQGSLAYGARGVCPWGLVPSPSLSSAFSWGPITPGDRGVG